MKILIIATSIDLKIKWGCTPAWWQLFKALHQLGNELIIIPYRGRDIDSLWWRCYKSPFDTEVRLLEKVDWLTGKIPRPKAKGESHRREEEAGSYNFIRRAVRTIRAQRLEKCLADVSKREKNIDVVLMMGVSIGIVDDFPAIIKKYFDVPLICYDGDFPWSLLRHPSNFYEGGRISGFDAFIINSKGGVKDVEDLGAQNVFTLQYGADPEVFNPIEVEQDIDVFFYGSLATRQRDWVDQMLIKPSVALPNVKFALGSVELKTDVGDIGNVVYLGGMPFNSWIRYCCRSKINLNITRRTHRELYATSTARPFELSSLKSCIVSNPYSGLEEWFEPGKEIFIVKDEGEAIALYKRLLESKEERKRAGELARKRVLAEHTYLHRAQELISIIEKVK